MDRDVYGSIRLSYTCGLVGGPIELESRIGTRGEPRYVRFSSDRRTWRISAEIDGVALADPAPAYFYSGPVVVAALTVDHPIVETASLGDHVALEDALDSVTDGDSARLTLQVARHLAPAATEEMAWQAPAAPAALFPQELTIDLRRDDIELRALVDRLVEGVRHGPREERERPLRQLLTLRAPLAVERWSRLADHPEPLVAERVRSVLEQRRR
jgi:hypothetical protein